MKTSAFMRGFNRGTVTQELKRQNRLNERSLRLVEWRIESAICARRTAKTSTITNDDLERLMLEWSIIREAVES